MNRNRGNAEYKEEEDRWEDMYLEQNTKVQILIKKELYKHEKITAETKESKDGGEKMWDYIKC